ncbi:Archaeal ribosome-binding protein aMBF1, putative translation factor, contains Zn-ribbon and HTH domains [Zhouia amylolytica]|uniref:Archaeal ribosome-binding protein aMBF1, putative translation factor, contains Zn-ribbon and HTH domains n=1 Tax=Zhouia amylolytica TaxID=376730 RepID=A0A1I6TUM7_9FLAO|nr:helix-turn-helix domain-containing protein [Zhouia amylolytica]MCQ0112560.1 helix-turn-helix domain-containing protein [Zhouia amylolytica]SFS92886.1 Archaeal ribosome-binding protein aMBF1, putative translation factor, contains Zn-ribbon and HTH domains [Zhouia amylolytica]
MDKDLLANRVKELRSQKGMSQELLAEKSGLSLRTIQRIENGESKPTGESLNRLIKGLNVNPDELMDSSIIVDKRYLTFMNLSALSFLLFPMLGILIPFIVWSAKKDKIKDINEIGKNLINFEITWTLILFFFPIVLLINSKVGVLKTISLRTFFMTFGLLYLINLIFILVNTIRINNEKNVFYLPQVKFLK